jgi:hypothetical protein
MTELIFSENLKIVDAFHVNYYLNQGWELVERLAPNEYLIKINQLPKGVNQ